jgi:hypothetical protein
MCYCTKKDCPKFDPYIKRHCANRIIKDWTNKDTKNCPIKKAWDAGRLARNNRRLTDSGYMRDYYRKYRKKTVKPIVNTIENTTKRKSCSPDDNTRPAA